MRKKFHLESSMKSSERCLKKSMVLLHKISLSGFGFIVKDWRLLVLWGSMKPWKSSYWWSGSGLLSAMWSVRRKYELFHISLFLTVLFHSGLQRIRGMPTIIGFLRRWRLLVFRSVLIGVRDVNIRHLSWSSARNFSMKLRRS